MSLSGREETGVKPVSWQSGDYSAGVPIKKRRFPIIRPPSPSPEEPSLVPAENDLLPKEQCGPLQASTISNASVLVSSSSLSNENKNILPEERKRYSDATTVSLVQNYADLSKVKLEEASLTIHSGSLAEIGSSEKFMAEGMPTILLEDLTKTELKLAPSEALGVIVGKKIHSQQKVYGQCELERSTVSGKTELSVGLKEQLVSALAGQNGEESNLNQENEETVSLNLSLSKEESVAKCKSDNTGSNFDIANTLAKRCNWDLNTTMDAWEGPVSDSGAAEVTVGGLETVSDIHFIKPLMISTGIVGVTSEKQILKANDTKSSTPSGQPYNHEDPLHLRLCPPIVLSNFGQQPSCSSARVDANGVIPNTSLPGVLMPTGNLISVNTRTVKAEPLDESVKHGTEGARVIPGGLLDFNRVKSEVVERSNLEVLKTLNGSTMKLLDDPRSIKSEPVNEGNQVTLKTMEGKSNQPDKLILEDLDYQGVPTCSTGLFIRHDVSQFLETLVNTTGEHHNEEVTQGTIGNAGPVASEMVLGQNSDQSNISEVVDTPIAEDKNNDDTEEHCRLKFMNELPDLRGTGEASESDEEKINLSGDMLEEDSYGSDYESDANHDLTMGMDTEQDGRVEDDFEDGEVREPQEHKQENFEIEGSICEKREVDHICPGDSGDKNARLASYDHPTSSHIEEKDTNEEDLGVTGNSAVKKCIDTVHDEKTNMVADNDTYMLELSTVEMPMSEADIEAIQGEPLDTFRRDDSLKGQEIEQSSNQATNRNPVSSGTCGQGSDDNIKMTDVVEKKDSSESALPLVKASSNGDDTAMDVNCAGNRSRIINLSRATNVLSPGKTRSISGRSLPSGLGRGRLPDVALDGDKLYPRGRDEIYLDSYQKFSRERQQDQSSRNSRPNLLCGRGRVSNRIDMLHGDWDSEHDLAPEFYNGPTEFHMPRHKFASGVVDANLEFNDYNIGNHGSVVGSGRGGRKIIDGETPIFRHLPSRRRSPRVRDGPNPRGLQMARRVPRNSGEGSELIGLRPSEKFMRAFPDGNPDPVFARPQTQYERLDGHFVRAERNFSSVQRRGLPRNRSKSPVRSRTRSPGLRMSPRERSQDGFGGHPELPHRRSPAVYCMERMRSPDHRGFPGEIVVRRHGSPSYMSRPTNDLRELDNGWEHGHPRSVIPHSHRSPSGRFVLRNNRRFDNVDPRERTDGDEFFGGPMHPGQFHELGGDGNGEERRRFRERRGPIRSFRPPYSGADGENFHLNADDGPRSFRFCPEGGTEFHERGSLRDRDFDRRMKNRPGNMSRRPRSIVEHEGNFRHGGQVWHEDGFDDISRMKRKRF
ncbi:hypothetical protein CFOL_v3_07257 [Cephalotus follicularis]|uniref:Uncharacterized protein n=1 Tax=Cephalotus follicularis TaxID=3775 RepID=A0A1Q3B745_CEPFO|nr:hypothetical protein CFOL_v3_07257 [Cephalotus follicularis]